MDTLLSKCTWILVRPLVAVRIICSTSKVNDKDNYKNLNHPEGREPKIPDYVEKKDEHLTVKKARLLYQSRKRGMLENGLLLSSFAKKYLDNFNEKQIQQYDRLINLPSNDWDIFYWATEVKPVPLEYQNEIMELLKNHIKNDKKEVRIRQPDLY